MAPYSNAHLGEVGIRPALPADSDMIFAWRNDPAVVAHSTLRKTVKEDEHRSWMAATFRNSDVRRLNVIEIGGRPSGLLRFDREGEQAVVSIYLVGDNHGRGCGVAALKSGCQAIFSEWDVVWIVAQVRDDNPRGQRAFEKAGFSLSDRLDALPGHRFYVLRRGSESALRDFQCAALADGLELDGARVLDIGCGRGDFLGWLRQHGIRPDYTGVEPSADLIKEAKQRFPEARFVEGGFEQIGRLATHSFEHVFGSGLTATSSGRVETVRAMFACAQKSLTFRCLSNTDSGNGRTGSRADPVAVLASCRHVTPWVILRHDYHAGEFTVRLLSEKVML